MSQHTPRKGRVYLPEHYYHITTCTHQRRPLFLSFSNARIVIQQMQKLQQHGVVTSVTWVLMPDHLHWLVQIHQATSLSNMVKRLKGCSAFYIKQKKTIQGTIWQKGFYDHAIRTDEDLAAISRYIVANPLRAGLVSRVADYPYWDSIYL